MGKPLFRGFYKGLSLLLYLLSLPFLLFLITKPKYRRSIPARFFLFKNPRIKECDVWIHACSLGEVKSLEPLMRELQSEQVLLSVITATGLDEAKRLYPWARVTFLPFEPFLGFWAPRCKSLVVVEAELWFSLFESAKKKGAKTMLLNARISDRSYPRYLRFRFFYERLFEWVDELFAQREEDRERLLALGAKEVSVKGNLKLLSTPVPKQLLPKPPKTLIVAASTHEGEEEMILEAVASLSYPFYLAIVPRHPERFDSVWKLLERWGVRENRSIIRRSQQSQWWSAEVTLVDSMGELIDLYAIAEGVILGGAFVPVGGHNPLEPAYFGCKILSGIHIHNQFALFENIEGYYLMEPRELLEYLERLPALPRSFIKGEMGLKPLLDAILHYKKEREIDGKSL